MTSRSRLIGLAVAASALAATAVWSPSPATADPGDAGDVDPGGFVEAVPREHRVLMISDSVGLGARNSVPAAFPAGWEVNVVGQPARFVEEIERGPCYWDFTGQYCSVDYLLQYRPDWIGDHVVIAAGYNYPFWDRERFDRSVDSLIDKLTANGVKHIYWVTLRELDPQYLPNSSTARFQYREYGWYFPQVNDDLRRAQERHPNLTLVDFAAHAFRSDITYDAIHLNPTGAALYADLVRNAVYETATQVRDGSTTRVEVPGGAGAEAAAVNLTTTFPRRRGNLVVHRCDEPKPYASVHNFVRSQVVAHAAIAPLDESGAFCVTTTTATNLVVDVTGLFLPDSGFHQTSPTRWVNTRDGTPVLGGETLVLDIDDIPDSAGIVGTPSALALTVTSADGAGRGYVRVSACDPDASHSNVNFDGRPTPNLVIAEPDDDGKVCFFVKTTTNLLVDVLGTFDETAVVDVESPQRIYNSTTDGGPVTGGETVVLAVGELLSDPSYSAVLNLTGLEAEAPTYFTAYPCNDGRPRASNLNVQPGQVAANAAIVQPDDDGEICVFTRATAHMIVDLLGEIGPSFTGFRPLRALDTRGD